MSIFVSIHQNLFHLGTRRSVWYLQTGSCSKRPEPDSRRSALLGINIRYRVTMIRSLPSFRQQILKAKLICNIKFRAVLSMIIIMIMISSACAVYWSSGIKTDTGLWYIYRQSSNVSFNNTQTIIGTVSPVQGLHGRILSPYQSTYKDIKYNDVVFKERRSALEGSYESTEQMDLISRIDDSAINIDFFKPFGSDVYTINYPEMWSVQLSAAKTINYSGKMINDWDYNGNNNDFINFNLLYNHQLMRETKTLMWLQRMNATVQATDYGILSAEFKPTKYLGRQDKIHSTGIADLSYRQAGSLYDVTRRNYPPISEGRERYYGTYDLIRLMEMKSLDFTPREEDEWLYCCEGGWESMMKSDRDAFGANASSVFDCSCYGV